MKVTATRTRPPEIVREEQRARRLEWATIGFLISIVGAIYVTMGSSQAMKAAWIEDMLSLIPPVSFLIASKVAHRDPDERFPWGYERAMSIAFLISG